MDYIRTIRHSHYKLNAENISHIHRHLVMHLNLIAQGSRNTYLLHVATN
jgi:hypothetical protein